MNTYNFPPSRIADETGVCCVDKNAKVLSQKGKTSWEDDVGRKGSKCDSDGVYDVIGTFIPPLLIFKRQRMNDRLMFNAPKVVGFA